MSHQLSIRNGRAEMFSGSGLTPWHKLGTVVAGLLNSAEALKAAGLDWPVIAEPVYAKNGDYRIAEGYKAIVRGDTGAILSVMSDRYQIIQNSEAFDFFDSVTQTNEAVYDTAGALHGGARVWIMAKLPGEMFINGDKHEKMVLLVTSHDGSYSLMMQQVLVRVVCQNTLSLALGGCTNQIKIRHSGQYKAKADEARRALGIADKYFATIQEALGKLGEQLLTPGDMAELSRVLVPTDNEKDVPTRTQNIRADINRLFQRGEGNKGQTRWDALQAVTDYVDHEQTTRGENSTRFESGLLGAGARLKQKTFETLTNDHIMAALMSRSHVPSGTTDTDFARLLNQ